MERVSYKLAGILLVSLIACLGTIPFGYHFADTLRIENLIVKESIGYLFAITAALANFALGAYSLLCIGRCKAAFNSVWLMIACLLIAIPTGFICFWGYYETLPFYLNLTMSFAVTLANAGIDYTAINNFILSVRERRAERSATKKIIKTLGFMVGLIASLTFYVVATDGLINLFSSHTKSAWLVYSSYILAFFIWLPSAALFANATLHVSEKLLQLTESVKPKITLNRWYSSLILLIAILSGASLAQIVIEFFAVTQNIPAIFKVNAIQDFIRYGLMPLAFISSSAVNYLALLNLANNWCEYQSRKIV